MLALSQTIADALTDKDQRDQRDKRNHEVLLVNIISEKRKGDPKILLGKKFQNEKIIGWDDKEW